jgi:hypothetical protein
MQSKAKRGASEEGKVKQIKAKQGQARPSKARQGKARHSKGSEARQKQEAPEQAQRADNPGPQDPDERVTQPTPPGQAKHGQQILIEQIKSKPSQAKQGKARPSKGRAESPG